MLLLILTSAMLMPVLSGIASPFFIKIIKNKLKWSGMKAMGLALGFSMALGFLAMWFSGEWSGKDLLLNIGIVFMLSQTTYQGLKEATTF